MHHPAQQKQQTDPAAATSQNTATNVANANAEVAKSEARAPDPLTFDGFNKVAQPAPGGVVGGGSPAAPSDSVKSADAEARPPAATFSAAPVILPTPSPAPPPPAQQTSELAATVSRPAAVKLEDNKAAEGKEKDRYDERNAAPMRAQRGHGPMRNETQQQMNTRNRQAEESQAADAAPRAAPKSDAGPARAAARGESRREKSGEGRGDDGGETRSVAGRRFRRQGDAWVDTSYRASQATVQIGRGSEQYRALVGDEPELGRIANALGGEVVVVWKGRAYRIR
jgi:hypothetical protein